MTDTRFHIPKNSGGRSHQLLAFCIWLILAPFGLLPGFQLVDYRIFDIFSTLSPPVPETTPVILVGIDEPSFAELNMQWPWPREIHGELIDSLSSAGAAVIALDIVFAEPSTDESDHALAESIRRAGNVLLASDLTVEETAYLSQLIRVEPLLVFLDAGANNGVAAVALDNDGVMRKLPSYQDGFAISALRAWQTANGFSLTRDVKNHRLLQFFGPSHSYPYVSYYQALDPDNFLPPGIFQNRIVIVGRSVKTTPDPSARQADTFATPFTLVNNDLMAGIEVHATILDNLRLGLSAKPAPGFMQPAGLALVVLISIFLFRGWHPWLGGISALIIMVMIMANSFALLRFEHIWLSPQLYLGGVILSYIGEGGMAFLRERLGRRRIKQAFNRYLSPVLVEQLASDPSQLRLGGETRLMTIMFCDIRGFTTLSERYKNDPESLVHLMNRFFTAMTAVIHKRDGTVDKYIGDCIMAFWNAPLTDKNHAKNSCSAALEMFDRLDSLNDELEREMKSQGLEPVRIDIGIGINTGLCVVGNIGSDLRFDYSVLGDCVNLASRLEGRTKKYGVGIVIGPETADAVPDFDTLELDLLAVKGKVEAERIFALLRTNELPDRQNLQEFAVRHLKMIEAYRRGDWPAAKTALKYCRTSVPALATIYDIYDQRISEHEKSALPENWTGVNTAKSK